MANMNSMLPTYQGNFKDMMGALKYGDITNPCWFWIEDRNDLAFIHWEKNAEGNKVLVPHVMLWEKVDVMEKTVSAMNTALGNIQESLPEGSTMADFVTETTEKTDELDTKVETVTEDVIIVAEQTAQTREQVDKIANAITMITSSDIKEEVTE